MKHKVEYITQYPVYTVEYNGVTYELVLSEDFKEVYDVTPDDKKVGKYFLRDIIVDSLFDDGYED